MTTYSFFKNRAIQPIQRETNRNEHMEINMLENTQILAQRPYLSLLDIFRLMVTVCFMMVDCGLRQYVRKWYGRQPTIIEAATQSNTDFPPGNSVFYTTKFTAKSALAIKFTAQVSSELLILVRQSRTRRVYCARLTYSCSLPRRYARECRAFLVRGSEHTMTVSARAIIAYLQPAP